MPAPLFDINLRADLERQQEAERKERYNREAIEWNKGDILKAWKAEGLEPPKVGELPISLPLARLLRLTVEKKVWPNVK